MQHGGMEYEKPGVGYGVRTGVSFPRRMFSSVDLPTPFGPTITTRQKETETDRQTDRQSSREGGKMRDTLFLSLSRTS